MIATITAVLLLAGCGAKEPSSAPSATPSVTTESTSSPAPSASPPTLSVEQAEINYNVALCSAALQVYVTVQENTLPNYSRAQYLGLEGCTDLTEPQYEVAIDEWAGNQ